ncbi:MAG: type I restriction enzyme HsdR N-terminal domain-containing protein [Chlamydiales bacterium]|nr:type I restriction enzyme HsdR N-terminal domain-containing protein [Chlamydiales bacterium]
MDLSGPSNPEVFDSIRGIWVRATPEEIIRQQLLKHMLDSLGYPKELIAVERDIRELIPGECPPALHRRLDLVCFRKDPKWGLKPLLIVECKAEKLDKQAIDQLMGYHFFIKSPYLSLISRKEVVFGRWDPYSGDYDFSSRFPAYLEL